MKRIIIGNFKMNTTPSEFKSYAIDLVSKTKGTKNDVVVCPPFTHLATAKDIFSGSHVCYGAQNISAEESGAYTGEVSASMVKDLDASYVIVGNYERRSKFRENDKIVNKKIKTALASGLKVVLCVGEDSQTKADRKAMTFIKEQIEDDLRGIYENELESVIVAYEPVWAIGTDRKPTGKDIEKMVETIRKCIEELYSEKAGKNIDIVYGGGVNLTNYKKILTNDYLNGILVGGECLNVDNFSVMARENY